MRVVSERKQYGRMCLWGEELNCNFNGLVRTLGFLSVAMVWREEFAIAWLRIFGGSTVRGNRSWQKYSGALTPSFLAEGVRPTKSNPVDLYRWGDGSDEDLLIARDTSLSRQSVPQ